MSWGLVPTAPTAAPTTVSPFSRMSIDRDGYGYSGGGYKKANHNAALSALALISFLFFLNLLQQQLSSGQQQTLLFMVNSTGGANAGRRRREAPVTESTDKRDLDAEQADAFQRELVRKYLTVAEEIPRGSSASVPELHTPAPAPAPPTNEWHELAAWMRGLLPASKLHPQLAQVLSDCRDILACTLHKVTIQHGGRSQPFLDDTVVKTILAATGEFSDSEDIKLEEACEDLMEMASSDCIDISDTFTNLIPDIMKAQQNLKHDPQDLL